MSSWTARVCRWPYKQLQRHHIATAADKNQNNGETCPHVGSLLRKTRRENVSLDEEDFWSVHVCKSAAVCVLSAASTQTPASVKPRPNLRLRSSSLRGIMGVVVPFWRHRQKKKGTQFPLRSLYLRRHYELNTCIIWAVIVGVDISEICEKQRTDMWN